MSSSSSSVYHRNAKCDICSFGDGMKGLTLIRCTDCQLYVHKECYGLETFQKKVFVCWPCRAVGQKFEIDVVKKKGKRMEITQEVRPTRCDLCGVQDGIHAMHPIYDNHGERGRQLYRPDEKNPKKKRLVWAHSLCAFTLTTQGLMYGCAQDGTYDGEDSDDSEDERSLNPGLVNRQLEGEYGSGDPVHHFVYYLKRPGKPHNEWTRAIAEKQQLRCCICGRDDREENVLRIPVQCCANDLDEYHGFKHTHSLSLQPGEACVNALHIGCAMYGKMNPKKVLRVFYDPGNNAVTDDDNIRGVYCTIHAEEVSRHILAKRKDKDSSSLSPAQSKAIRRASNPSPSFKKKTLRPPPAPALPSLARLAPEKKRRGSSKGMRTSQPAAASADTVVDPLGQHLNATKKTKKPKWYEGVRDDAKSVSQLPRPLLVTKRKDLANQKSIVHESDEQKMLADLIDKAGNTRLSPAARKAIMKGRKTYWKRELSELASDHFLTMWQKAKQDLIEYIVQKKSSATATAPSSLAPPPARLQTTSQPTRRGSATSSLSGGGGGGGTGGGQPMRRGSAASSTGGAPTPQPRKTQGPPSDQRRQVKDKEPLKRPTTSREPSTSSTNNGNNPVRQQQQQQQKSAAPPSEITIDLTEGDEGEPAAAAAQPAVEKTSAPDAPAPSEDMNPAEPDETGGQLVDSDPEDSSSPVPVFVAGRADETPQGGGEGGHDDNAPTTVTPTTPAGERERRTKNEFAHLTIGKNFNNNVSFTFDEWDEVI